MCVYTDTDVKARCRPDRVRVATGAAAEDSAGLTEDRPGAGGGLEGGPYNYMTHTT